MNLVSTFVGLINVKIAVITAGFEGRTRGSRWFDFVENIFLSGFTP